MSIKNSLENKKLRRESNENKEIVEAKILWKQTDNGFIALNRKGRRKLKRSLKTRVLKGL